MGMKAELLGVDLSPHETLEGFKASAEHSIPNTISTDLSALWIIDSPFFYYFIYAIVTHRSV